MKNLEKFSAKTQYVTPWCKSVELRSKQMILTGSGNYDGRWHTERLDDDGEEVDL